MLLSRKEACFLVAKDISAVLKCVQITEISMSSANHCEIKVVTLQQLYFLGLIL